MVARWRTTMPMAVNTAPARAAATTRACSSTSVLRSGRLVDRDVTAVRMYGPQCTATTVGTLLCRSPAPSAGLFRRTGTWAWISTVSPAEHGHVVVVVRWAGSRGGEWAGQQSGPLGERDPGVGVVQANDDLVGGAGVVPGGDVQRRLGQIVQRGRPPSSPAWSRRPRRWWAVRRRHPGTASRGCRRRLDPSASRSSQRTKNTFESAGPGGSVMACTAARSPPRCRPAAHVAHPAA